MKTPTRWNGSIGHLLSRFPPQRLPGWLKTRILAKSGLIQPAWYGRATDRRIESPLQAARCFVASSNDPENAANPLFSADWYRSAYGFEGSAADALLHYVLVGERQGFKPHPWFDPGYFRKFNKTLPGGIRSGIAAMRSALATYCANWQLGLNPHPHFDGNWYLWQYPDVAGGDLNPLAHFVVHGMKEGREPNAYFSSRWYMSTFEDVRRSGEVPAHHFNMFGAAEMRSPGPNFDMRRYADQYPDYLDSGLDPLGHFLAIGRAEGRSAGTRYLHLWELIEESPEDDIPSVADTAVLDVIVPVYRGLAETQRCIESLVASGPKHRARMRIRVLNDASPEPEVTAYLRQASSDHGFLLHENPSNLGFVGTVNKGMRAAMQTGDCDAVILLNSDTEVSSNWADRLFAHTSRQGAGTVTATSNNATICSYPSIGSHELPPGFSLAEVDRAARQANPGVSVEIPTAVGFCMLIARQCLEDIGYFDEEAFGRGYGEENDFCMRASAKGYRHLHALDVFVYHAGEVSFAEAGSPGKKNAATVIRQRYPDYEAQVARLCAADPAKIPRLRLLGALWRAGGRPVTAIITHDLGGGTEKHVQSILKKMDPGSRALVIRPGVGHDSLLRLENFSAEDEFDVIVDALHGPGFASLLSFFGVGAIQLHHLYGHGPLIREGIALSGIAHTLDIHDYYLICPQITLTTAAQEYCGEPAPAGCDACIAERPSLGATDIRNWREAQAWAVEGAREVRAPSLDTVERISRYFPVRPLLRYHEDVIRLAPTAKPRKRAPGEPIRVVMLGVLSLTKGRKKVFEAIEASEALGLPLHFHLVGDSEGVFPLVSDGRFTSTGWYIEDELEGLIAAARPDLFLFASAAPETYSYTLTAAMGTGIPILATDLGAFAERLQGYETKALYPHRATGEDLARLIHAFATGLCAKRHATGPGKVE